MMHKRTLPARTAALALALSLAVGALASCSSSPASSNGVNSAGSGASSASGGQTPTKLTIAMMNDPNVEDFETNYFTQVVEKDMNVDLSFYMLPADSTEAQTKISLLINSGGDDLPDVFNVVFSDSQIYEYGSKGAFINLSDYYADKEKTPRFNAIPKDDRDLLTAALTCPDGKIYSFPRYPYNPWNEAPYRAWISTDWLAKVNKTIPKTTDELYELLLAFKNGDPNGNGKQDEIGIVGASGWAQNVMVYLMNAFLYANPDKAYFDVNGGKVFASFVQPEWKQGLEYMKRLVDDGLLDPVSFTQDQTQMKSLINVENGMAGIVTAGSYSVFDTAILGNDPDNGKGMILLPPVKGPSGKGYTPQNATRPQHLWAITKDCKTPDVAVAVGDYFLTEDAYMMSTYGEEGVDWSENPADFKDYALTPSQEKAKWHIKAVLFNDLWSKPNNKTWQNICPKYSEFTVGDVYSTLKASEADTALKYDAGPSFYETYTTFFRDTKDLITKFSYTEDEAKTIADIKTVIDNYVKEQSVAFITGNRSLNDWDNYINDLNKMELDQYIKVNQAAYDRTK